MKRTQFLLTVGLSVIVGGCSVFQPRAELNIRPVEGERLATIESDPVSAGRKHLALGQNGLAISAFREALRKNPDSAAAYNGLGIAYDRIGRADLAQRYFELAVAAAPADARYGTNLARLFERRGQPEMAQGLTLPHSPAVAKAEQANAGVAIELPPLVAIAANSAEALEDVGLDPIVPETETIQQADSLAHADAVVVPVAPKPAQQFAVHRAAAPVAIRAAAIDAATLPQSPRPPAAPDKNSGRVLFDVPRTPAFPDRRDGVRLERLSLGEVRLVTRPYALDLAKPPAPKLASAAFEGFGAKLATWLPDAIAAEGTANARPEEGAAFRQALAHATLEMAVEEAAASSAGSNAEQRFTYAFFEDGQLLETSLASL